MSTVVTNDVVDSPRDRRRYRVRTIAFWFFTLVLALEMVAGAVWDLLQIDYVRGVMDHLGYPHYILLIIGAAKFPCAVAVMVPGFPRLKEWAYAGAVINYGGAAASHALAGDPMEVAIQPLGYVAFAFASWALRPADRRLPPAPKANVRLRAWIVPLVVVGAFLVIAFLTLSTAPPPPPSSSPSDQRVP